LVEARAVACAYVAFEVVHLVGDGVEDGAAGVEFCDLSFDLFRCALDKHLAEDAGGALLGWDGDAAARPGERARRCVDGQGE
jgi:hypothetical protein